MKRLVICADGTWNIRDQVNAQAGRPRPTNVTKTARAVLPQGLDHVDQLVFYHDGLGTGDPFDRLTGGAFGRGIEENIRVLYRFLHSMTLVYRAMGEHVRPLGQYAADGETIHQAAIDRKDLADCKYDAPNLAVCLSQPQHLRVVTTTRISRGTPCAAPVPHHDE